LPACLPDSARGAAGTGGVQMAGNNYGKIPHSINGEALEMVPPEIEEEVNLICKKGMLAVRASNSTAHKPASQRRQ
jgi:hypothetical protein